MKTIINYTSDSVEILTTESRGSETQVYRCSVIVTQLIHIPVIQCIHKEDVALYPSPSQLIEGEFPSMSIRSRNKLEDILGKQLKQKETLYDNH